MRHNRNRSAYDPTWRCGITIDKAAALKFLKRIMKKYGAPRQIVTDGLCSYSAAMNEIGATDRQEVGGRLNNRAENSHQLLGA